MYKFSLMNYKEAVATPTQPPPKAVETPYLTIDEAYDEIHKVAPLPVADPPPPQACFSEASDHVANIYNSLTGYWRTKGYLTKSTVPSFCDMLRDVFQVEYVPSEDEDSL